MSKVARLPRAPVRSPERQALAAALAERARLMLAKASALDLAEQLISNKRACDLDVAQLDELVSNEEQRRARLARDAAEAGRPLLADGRLDALHAERQRAKSRADDYDVAVSLHAPDIARLDDELKRAEAAIGPAVAGVVMAEVLPRICAELGPLLARADQLLAWLWHVLVKSSDGAWSLREPPREVAVALRLFDAAAELPSSPAAPSHRDLENDRALDALKTWCEALLENADAPCPW